MEQTSIAHDHPLPSLGGQKERERKGIEAVIPITSTSSITNNNGDWPAQHPPRETEAELSGSNTLPHLSSSSGIACPWLMRSGHAQGMLLRPHYPHRMSLANSGDTPFFPCERLTALSCSSCQPDLPHLLCFVPVKCTSSALAQAVVSAFYRGKARPLLRVSCESGADSSADDQDVQCMRGGEHTALLCMAGSVGKETCHGSRFLCAVLHACTLILHVVLLLPFYI